MPAFVTLDRFSLKILHLAAAAVILSACTQPAATAILPTGNPQPTEYIYPTNPPAAQLSPLPTFTAFLPISPPTDTPLPAVTELPQTTETTTPEAAVPLKLVQKEIRIITPGSLSKVASPLTLEASAVPGESGAIRIELIGEDGRLLFREVNGYAVSAGQRVSFSHPIDFEIPGVSEAARLQISVSDAYGRVTSLSSVSLVLLSVGESLINLPVDQVASFIVTQPVKNQAVTGGKIQLVGFTRPVSPQPIRFDLIGRQGETLGSRLLKAPSNEDGAFAPFETDISYAVKASTWALLVIHQADTRIPGDAALTSIPILLQP